MSSETIVDSDDRDVSEIAMTPKQFEEAASRTRLGERSVEAARLVLCEAMTYADAGREVGEPEGNARQLAYRAAETVRRAFQDEGGWPDGWEVVTVCVDPKSAREIRAQARRVLREHRSRGTKR